VDVLEKRYGGFDGLNLMFETREGILKHCSPMHAAQLGDIGQRFLEKKQPTLEAHLANLADEIAYNNHDIDDGLRSGLLTIQQLYSIDFFARHKREAEAAFPGIQGRRAINETVRRMINALIVDLINTSRERIRATGVQSVDEVRIAGPLIAFSDTMRSEALLLKRFLRKNLYQHYQVNRMTSKARRVIRELFDIFMQEPVLLPPAYQVAQDAGIDARENKAVQARSVADYIAGMTDRYAMREHRRLFAIDET
jgi:dGTPase